MRNRFMTSNSAQLIMQRLQEYIEERKNQSSSAELHEFADDLLLKMQAVSDRLANMLMSDEDVNNAIRRF